MSDFTIKQKKEIDWQFVIRALFCYFLCVAALLAILIWNGGNKFTYVHFFILSICAIPLSILCAFIVEKAGSGLGSAFLGWTTKGIGLREQLSSDLEKARYNKGNNRFEEAIEILDDVLSKDENFPDALFLKAQVLWEGFGKSVEAKNLFRRVMRLVPVEEPLYRWSSNYINQIAQKDKERVDEFKSEKQDVNKYYDYS